jgi:hypothetical protein
MTDDKTPKNSPQLTNTRITASSSEGLKPKDIWDKIDVIGKLLGTILIPFALVATGFFVNLTLQDRAAKEKTAEIAITVLQSNSTALPELRNWALGVFEDTVLAANQKLPDAARKELKTLPLPDAGRSNPSAGLPDGTPCGAYPNMVVEDGQCKFKSAP